MQPTWDAKIDWVLWLVRHWSNFDHFLKPIDLSRSLFSFLLAEKEALMWSL